MLLIRIDNVPNQVVNLPINGNYYSIRIVKLINCYAATVIKNGETLIENVRLVEQGKILPYKHLEIDGNFYLHTENDSKLNYKEFGITQHLYYLDPSEL